MSISHVTNFEKPAISPFLCIFLELIEGRCVRDGVYLENFARTSAICAPLCSLVFFETFVRDTTKFVNASTVMQEVGLTEFLSLGPWHRWMKVLYSTVT